MAILSSIFPAPKLIHNIAREYVQTTTIVQNGVQEYRISKQRYGRHRWTLNQKSFDEAGLAEVLLFLDSAEYSLYSFLFADPHAPAFKNEALPYATGTSFYLRKPAGNGLLSMHPIFHLDAGVVVTKNGVPTAFTKSIVNGIPYISVTGAAPSDVIRITGKYYHSVRLDQASTVSTIAALDINNNPIRTVVGQLALTEVFEY